jgi:hypothetical protein
VKLNRLLGDQGGGDGPLSQVNANLKADTTDVLMGRKKSMHMTAFRYRIDEISERLQANVLSPRCRPLSEHLEGYLHFLISALSFCSVFIIDRHALVIT